MLWLLGFAAFGMLLAGIAFLVNLVAVLWALVTLAGAPKDVGYKLIWAVIVLLLGLIGALVFYFLEYQHWPAQKRKR